jgi:hypothetical protein
VFVEIRINNKVLATPFVVQPSTKPISCRIGGTCLEIIPLPVQTFTIHVSMTTIVNQPMEGSERFNEKHDEPINPSFTILDSRLKSLEFISTSVPLTPHQIGIG